MADVLEQLRAALGDRYDVERLVGEGGMATVFLAQDRRHDRRVAVKTLRPELAASIGADRFLREIRVAARLQHPNVLALYDSGQAGGILYYVMPFVEGESLRERLNRELQLPLYDAIRITREAAEGLAYAHERGVVHRDIKPENILLQNGHALVADFGIARAVDAAGEKLTQSGMAVGTPHYMSPEQALGADHADGRSDVYSLGCVLYELLVGQPPFDGPNTRAIMARHQMEQVPGLRIVRQSISEEIEDVVFQALEKTPADRFQKMSELAEILCDLESTVATRRTMSRGVPAVQRATPRGTRATIISTPSRVAALKLGRGARFWSVAGLVAALAVGIAVWRPWITPGSASGLDTGGLDPRRIAVLYFGGEPGSDSLGYLADGLTEGLIGELKQVQSLDVVSKGGVAPFRGQSIPRDSIARALRAGTLVIGNVEREAGKVLVTVRLVDGASGADFERAGFELPAGDPLAAQRALAEKATGLIRERLGEEVRLREQREGTRNPEAWAAVQQANRHRKTGDAAAESGDSVARDREFAAADSLFARAERQDQAWIEPLLGRAALAYRRSRLAGDQPLEAGRWIQQGVGHVERAFALDGENPEALELRGNLRYWRWLLSLEADPTAARALLAAAKADLEAAVREDPAQAGAWATLSHLYYQDGNAVDVKLAARRAYEADAYLSNANVVLSRLFYSSYDLGQFPDAVHWCAEGQRRFPQDSRFVECQLYLLTTKAREPDVALAWRLADSLVALAPRSEREFQRHNAHMMIAATLARAGLGDSARRVAVAARGRPEMDPTRDLLYAEAFVRTLLGDTASAISALRTYLAANPQKRTAFAEEGSWWFRPLEGTAAYRELVGTGR
ncbi:MAG: protein kinase domain-containing protein [Gemmatimonadales bacterium]